MIEYAIMTDSVLAQLNAAARGLALCIECRAGENLRCLLYYNARSFGGRIRLNEIIRLATGKRHRRTPDGEDKPPLPEAGMRTDRRILAWGKLLPIAWFRHA
jgi:hypothetical protein